MFKFFTVLLFFITLFYFKYDYSKHLKVGKHLILDKEVEPTDEQMKSFCWTAIVALNLLILCFTEVIYALNAVSVDVYKYPTYVMLVILLLNTTLSIMLPKKNKPIKFTDDMSYGTKKELAEINAQQAVDNYNKPLKKFKRYCIRTYFVLYYAYMIYIVFIM
jgi:hypothetical protein